MPVLQYASSKLGKAVLVTVGGSIDAETAPKFNEKLQAELRKGAAVIVCNMAQLDYIASAGLGILISINEELGRKGGRIVISSMNEKVHKIFKLLGFLSLFPVYDSDEKALESVT